MWHGLHDSINFDKIGYNMCSWFLFACACWWDGICYAGCVMCFSSVSPVDGDLHPVMAETEHNVVRREQRKDFLPHRRMKL